MTGTQAVLFGLAHLFGDYVVQSDWMAQTKTRPGREGWAAALAHGAIYAACYLAVTTDVWALLVIGGTHVAIDHWRLARHLCWAKNQLAPKGFRYPLNPVHHNCPQHPYCNHSWAGPHGYRRDKPDWLAYWLMFIADNSLHLAINLAAIVWLT